ncbi:MAG: DUF423 domain-containing protein [Elusimicrobia bacterium]|nr:DUF423 domain-containing protein [Elusimicrobiota bacterium]
MLLDVALGAFAAHGLKGRLGPDMLQVFETGARYQAYHALALVAVGLIAARWPSPAVDRAGWCFLGGIVLFSGSLYALALTGEKRLGMITPAGGLLFLIGWALLAFARLRA